MELTPEWRAEIPQLIRDLGRPTHVSEHIDDSFDDPIHKPDRTGEVCMVVRRPNGKLLLAIKTFYPEGAYRLPTGGIHHGESIRDAAVREAYEETGLELGLVRFLTHVIYLAPKPVFHTFAFLFEERGGTLGAIDATEEIADWREVDVAELPAVAENLASLTTAGARDIGGSWGAWGKFRAVVHRAVHDVLTSPDGRTGTR